MLMGFVLSPYHAGRMMYRAIEFAKDMGNTEDNPFAVAKVILNLPCSKTYDPTMPRIQKVNAQGNTACDCCVYCDDCRAIGPDEESCGKAERQIVSKIQYLGAQDATRKRKPGGKRAGAWAGTVVRTDKGVP